MKDFAMRMFTYSCRCGNTVKVFIDCGIPMEQYRCRSCGTMMLRKES
ncbi:MAG: hypothetical protein JXA20_05955 [Spirochaetes bacterium]|nr:hypothetical protein [Spirochaetota bacterium]